MWIRVTDTNASPAVSLVLDETYLTECSYRQSSNRKPMIICAKPYDPTTTSLEEKAGYYFDLQEVQIELYSDKSLLKTITGCFNAYAIQDTSDGRTMERAEFMVGFKNVNGEFVAVS